MNYDCWQQTSKHLALQCFNSKSKAHLYEDEALRFRTLYFIIVVIYDCCVFAEAAHLSLFLRPLFFHVGFVERGREREKTKASDL